MRSFKINFTVIPFILLHLYLFAFLWSITAYVSHSSLLGIAVAAFLCFCFTLWQMP